VPEIIEDGVTGFVVDDETEALIALRRLPSLDRRRIREEFERRFTASQMAERYLSLYRELAAAPGELEMA
jgi:glycosyltransferase involved in cell wall biosynthesis